uniref:Uncharacterized protein n=1 Tax=Panstrongylus lignarius TaxID=156445 RepID=A0A224XU09_9HEMI
MKVECFLKWLIFFSVTISDCYNIIIFSQSFFLFLFLVINRFGTGSIIGKINLYNFNHIVFAHVSLNSFYLFLIFCYSCCSFLIITNFIFNIIIIIFFIFLFYFHFFTFFSIIFNILTLTLTFITIFRFSFFIFNIIFPIDFFTIAINFFILIYFGWFIITNFVIFNVFIFFIFLFLFITRFSFVNIFNILCFTFQGRFNIFRFFINISVIFVIIFFNFFFCIYIFVLINFFFIIIFSFFFILRGYHQIRIGSFREMSTFCLTLSIMFCQLGIR